MNWEKIWILPNWFSVYTGQTLISVPYTVKLAICSIGRCRSVWCMQIQHMLRFRLDLDHREAQVDINQPLNSCCVRALINTVSLLQTSQSSLEVSDPFSGVGKHLLSF